MIRVSTRSDNALPPAHGRDQVQLRLRADESVIREILTIGGQRRAADQRRKERNVIREHAFHVCARCLHRNVDAGSPRPREIGGLRMKLDRDSSGIHRTNIRPTVPDPQPRPN